MRIATTQHADRAIAESKHAGTGCGLTGNADTIRGIAAAENAGSETSSQGAESKYPAQLVRTRGTDHAIPAVRGAEDSWSAGELSVAGTADAHDANATFIAAAATALSDHARAAGSADCNIAAESEHAGRAAICSGTVLKSALANDASTASIADTDNGSDIAIRA